KCFTIGSSVNAAVAAFTKCLADLGKEDGVRVNCIHPSLVETERQWRRIRAEVERTGEPKAKVRTQFCRETGIIRYGKVEVVADFVTFIVSSRATWQHEATVDLDGGEIPLLRCPAAMSSAMNILLTAARIGALEVPNRIVMPAMTTRTADDEGYVTDDTIAYYLARAQGGVGLITVEMASPEKAGRHRRREVGLYDDRFLPGLTRLVDEI